MQKYRGTDIRPFEFTDLKGDHVVSGNGFRPFVFEDIQGESVNGAKAPSEEVIRKERSFEKNTSFKIDGLVREYRGLSRQEQSDLEQKIEQEVKARLETAYQEAYAEGLARGIEEGRSKAQEEWEAASVAKVTELTQVIEEVTQHSQNLLDKNREDIYEFIRRFTKWVILKEIDQKTYLENLLERLVLELNARKNLIIKVGKNNFSQMPEVVSAVEQKLGQLSNVRIEIVPEVQHPGIILESENGLIDGSLEGVFATIDKVFEQVLKTE